MIEHVVGRRALAREREAALRSMDIGSIVESTRTDNTHWKGLTKVKSLAQAWSTDLQTQRPL